MRKISYREALRAGLEEALINDPRVYLIGEDVGAYGGTYAVSKDLLKKFGQERIYDAPLSEIGFTGFGVGSAMAGMRPIVEIMTVNFSLLALDQIVNSAAMMRYMSGGEISVPLVIRMTTGGGRQLAAQHSNSFEGWYAHIPGIKILTPATVEDARYMLSDALNDPDPVIIFEHALLLNCTDDMPEEKIEKNSFKALIRREGESLTLVTYGGMFPRCLEAAEEVAKKGPQVEVIDLRCLRPLDIQTILDSVKKTHRLLVVDEGWKSGSISAEISTQIMERGFYDLDKPVARLCRREVPMAYAKHLEEATIPQKNDIFQKIMEMLS